MSSTGSSRTNRRVPTLRATTGLPFPVEPGAARPGIPRVSLTSPRPFSAIPTTCALLLPGPTTAADGTAPRPGFPEPRRAATRHRPNRGKRAWCGALRGQSESRRPA